MRAQEEVLSRLKSLEEEIEGGDLPDEFEARLEAQAEILEWVLRGDVLPDEYLIEGKLKNSGEFFDEVILAGIDDSGRVYPSATVEETGQFVLARRPTPQERERQKEL